MTFWDKFAVPDNVGNDGLTWSLERLIDECKRWRAYDYTKAEILTTLRNPQSMGLHGAWSQAQIDAAIDIVEATF